MIRHALIRNQDVKSTIDWVMSFGRGFPKPALIAQALPEHCPWLRWDPNPFPRFRLFRWLP